MKNWTWIIVVGVIVGLAAIYGVYVNRAQEGHMPELDGASYLESIQDFGLKDFEGNEVQLSEYMGKPLVINSWAVWCPFCLEELPDFATIQEEFGDEVLFIAINRAEPTSRAKGYTDGIGVTDRLMFLQDPTDSFYSAIGGFTMPETVFVNPEGEVVFHKRGPMDLDETRTRVENLLKQ